MQNIESSPPLSFDVMDWERFPVQVIDTSRPLSVPNSALTIHNTGTGEPAGHSTKRTASFFEADEPLPRDVRRAPG